MGAFIAILLIGTVVLAFGFGLALALRSRKEFAKQNEVVPGVPSAAPASWAGSHSEEAKLHRRLRDAVAAALANPHYVELGLAEQTAQIEAEAVAIDERLVAVSNLPERNRVEPMAKLEAAVTALENAVAALVTSTDVGDTKELLEQAVSDADIRLQALAEARAEVERIDQDPGTATSP
ncbi:MAG: hypothetical protein ACR2O6_03990 [Ilumatobacteraceae bacterium]